MRHRRTWHSCQPMDLHSLARQWFMASRRIELQKLARELGISRATAYRWAGSAEQLVGEVIASLVEDSIATMAASSSKTGEEKILEVLDRGMRLANEFNPLRRLLNDSQQALRIVASKEGPVQKRTIDALARLLTDEIDAGHMSLPVSPEVMAYALTRMVESFLYSDLIAGVSPDLDNASRIMQLMLRQDR